MTDGPIMFSAPMVRALLNGQKTQTRRLANSPLSRRAAGDRLWVREAWRTLQKWNAMKPAHLIDDRGNVTYEADPENRNPLWAFGRLRASMHMPRWASRLTLSVTETRIERLHDITADDAKAEGVIWAEPTADDVKWAEEYAAEHGGPPTIDGVWTVPGAASGAGADVWHVDPRGCYSRLWDSLRPAEGQRWVDNPEVLVLSFDVKLANIDQLS